jgi:membrane associated rhomboid family serine protease
MLSDRPYMNENYSRERTSVHIWLISIIGAAFVVELVLMSPWWPAGQQLVSSLILTPTAIRSWHLWTLLTHGLIHDNSNPFHILFILCSLYFLGRELTPLLGSKRLLSVFLASLVTGAVAWTALHWWSGGAQFGATAGVLGLFVVLACVFPDHQISFMLIPVSLRPRTLVWGLVALELVGLVLYEIRGGSPVPLGLTPSAHLGGLLAGWVYYRFFHARDGWDRAPSPLLRWPAWLRRGQKAKAQMPGTKLNLSQRSGLRSEVDRILDKINSQGFGSLTNEEKRVLDEAKDLLSRH